MFKAFKALPLLPKVLIGFVLLMGVYGLSHRRHAQPFGDSGSMDDQGPGERGEYPSPNMRGVAQRPSGDEAEQASEYLERFKNEQAQVQAQTQACMAQMQQATNQMASAAMNGQMMNNRPACEQAMPQLVAQEAYLETEIYRLQSGDKHSTLQQITGVQTGPSGNGYYRPSGPGNDGGIGAVDKYDRQAIRGTSLYSDENGEQHELQTAPYYYRDRSSGQMVPSNQPQPPNDGRDYETLTPQE